MLKIRAIAIEDKKAIKEFLGFAWEIYKNDPHWVAPLWMDLKSRFDLKKFPFFNYGEIQPFVAIKNGKIVGRIAAINNRRYNEIHQDKLGFFGYFECINDKEVANSLFAKAETWLKQKGLQRVNGPASPSSNYDYGLLVEGFNDSPRLMMTYNPEYYINLIESYGFTKNMGLLAYKIDRTKAFGDGKLQRVADLATKRYGLSVRYLNKKKMKAEMEIVKRLFNLAWEDNYGFIPFTNEELDLMADEFKLVADEDFLPFVLNDKGEEIGMAIALKDFNQIFKSFNGNLFPFNFLKLFTQKKKIDWLRILLLGVLPEYRNKGIDAVLYRSIINNCDKHNIKYGEASWILEDNAAMCRAAENVMQGKLYKKYNVYEKVIS